MAEHNTRLLSSHPEAYSRSFQCFLASTQQENAILKCIEEHIVPVINKVISELPVPFRVLSVGSGEGENDINILKALCTIRPVEGEVGISLINRVIEPDVARLAKFREKAEKLHNCFKTPANVDFEWIPMTFQEYMSQKMANDVKFDLVHFIHSIYYVEVEDALVHCYENELGKKGILMAISQGVDNPMLKFADKFVDQLAAPYPSNCDVIAVASERGWKFIVCPGDGKNLDITTIFDSFSREGNYILDFLSNRVNVRRNEEKESVEKILKFWEEQSFNNEHGRRIVDLRDNAVIILKGFGA